MNWKAVVFPPLVVLLIGGIYLFYVFKQRSEPGVQQKQAQQHVNPDDLAVVRLMYPAHFEDVEELAGKSVWMKNGYSMPYYPYAGGRVNFAKQAGQLAPAERLDVKKAIKAVAPASVDDKIEHGARQAMLVFAFPGGTELYATPTGFEQGEQETYYCDMLYFYDDPHGIYSNWPKEMWAAVDAHQPKIGMNELQMSLALGMNIQTDSQDVGNRTVTYDVNGKKTNVTFVNDKATTIQAQ